MAVLARELGPGAYGLMGMAATVTALLTNFRDLGTAAAIIQRPAISRELLCTLFWANQALGIILMLALALASWPIAWFFHQAELAALLQVLSLSFVFQSAGTVHNALLNREMRFRATAAADIVSAAAGYAVAIPMAVGGLGVWSLVMANLASSLSSTVVHWWASGWKPSFLFSGSEIRKVAGFSLNLSGFGLVNYVYRNADNVIVGRVLGAGPLGSYQMAYNLMMYPLQNVTSTLSRGLLPAFSRVQDDNKRFGEAFIRACSLIALITFPLTAGMGITAPSLVSAILGPKWIPAIPVFQILAPVGMVQSIHTLVGVIYIAKARTDWMFRMGIFSMVALVGAFLIGVGYGITGVATAYGVAYFVVTLYPTLAVPLGIIDLKVAAFARQLWPQVMITGIMVAGCGGWQWLLSRAAVTNVWIQLLSTVVIGAATYTLLMRWLRPPAVRYAAETLSQLDFPAGRLAARVFRRVAGL